MGFRNRADAGRRLALRLRAYAARPDVIVLGLPRGGVPVAWEIARMLQVPWDVFLVRKLGVPEHPELAMGAIALGGVRVLNERLIRELGIPPDAVELVCAREQVELDRRDRLYRAGRPAPVVRDRVVILVDDGLATGASMEAAITAVRQVQPLRVVAAAPVGATATVLRLERLVDELICLETPVPFNAVGQWYDDFSETSDHEVQELLTSKPGRDRGAGPA